MRILLFIRIDIRSLNNYINTYKIKIKCVKSDSRKNSLYIGISRKQWHIYKKLEGDV